MRGGEVCAVHRVFEGTAAALAVVAVLAGTALAGCNDELFFEQDGYAGGDCGPTATSCPASDAASCGPSGDPCEQVVECCQFAYDNAPGSALANTCAIHQPVADQRISEGQPAAPECVDMLKSSVYDQCFSCGSS